MLHGDFKAADHAGGLHAILERYAWARGRVPRLTRHQQGGPVWTLSAWPERVHFRRPRQVRLGARLDRRTLFAHLLCLVPRNATENNGWSTI